MCRIFPPLWAFSDLEKKNNITVRIGPLRISHIFILSLLSVVSSVWNVFGFIFSTRDLHRNLCIIWRVRTNSDGVIFMSEVLSCQLAMYWVLRVQLFISLITSTKNIFSKVELVSGKTRSDISKKPIKVGIFVKMR